MAYQLELNKRTEQGHKAKALRDAGLVTSVVYGAGKPVLTKSVYNATEKVLNEAGYHSPIELDIDGKKQLAIVKDVNINPVNRRILNVEFQAVSADEIVEATTPITIINFDQSDAAKLHYTILQVMEEIDVKAKPSDLPKELVADGGKLATLEDKLTVADLQLPSGVELVDHELADETVIANVYDPAAEAAARESEETQTEPTAPEAAATTEEAKAE